MNVIFLSIFFLHSALALSCGQVKEFYQDSSCCEAEDSSDVLSTCGVSTPDFGYPKCFSTYLDVANQYLRDEPLDYLPIVDDFVYRPYVSHTATDCLSVVPQTALHVPHSSPLGITILDTDQTGFPTTYHQKLIVGLTGSWNREAGTQSGGQWDMADLVVKDGILKTANRENFYRADPSFVRSQTHVIRPVDLKKSPYGGLFSTAKQGGDVAGLFAVLYQSNSSAASGLIGDKYTENQIMTDMNSFNENVGMWVIDTEPCARRIAFTNEFMVVTYVGKYCGITMKDENGDDVPNPNTYSALKAYKLDPNNKHTYNVSAYVVRNLHGAEGMAFDSSSGTLYFSTSSSCSGNLGARALKIENADLIFNEILSGDRDVLKVISSTDYPSDVIKVVGMHPGLYTWHNFVTIDISEDKKYLLAQRGANCNWGCEGYVYAMRISDGSLFEFANGFRNPTGITVHEGHVYISDMGSDMGINMPEEFSGGQHGPNDRLVVLPYTEPSISLVDECIDDEGGKVEASGTTCAALQSEYGCDGLWTFPEYAFFGPAAQLYVKDECQVTCASCLSQRPTESTCVY